MLIRRRRDPLVRYGVAIVTPLLCISIDLLLGLGILQETPYLLLLLAVLTSAWYGGIGPGLVSTAVAGILGVFFHLGPVGSFTVNPGHLSRLGIFLAASVLVSVLGAARLTAEGELRARKEELEITLASIGDAVIATDTAGIVTFINPVASRLLGWSSREATGRELSTIFVAVDESTGAPIPDFEDRLLQSEHSTGSESRTVLVARDGTRIPIDISAAPIRSDSQKLHGAVLVFHDTSERRRQEVMRSELLAALQHERMRINDLVSSVPGIVWEAWGAPNDAAQRMNFVSDYVETLLGYSRAEWLATPNFWLTIVHPDDRERAAETAAETFRSQHVGLNQFRWIARDGRTIWVETRSRAIFDAGGNPVGMRGVTTDISASKSTEEALRRWEQLFRHAGWGVAISNPEDNTLEVVNPAFASMHGYTVEELARVPLVEMFAPEERERLPAIVAEVNRRGHYVYESLHITRDGRRFPVLTDVIAVRDNDGRVLYRAANLQDISEQRRVEQELRAAMMAAEAASLAKDNFLAMLSHELRTPLTPVFTAAHLLAEAEGLSAEDRELVSMITQSVELEARLIDDLLELTRINQGKLHLAVDAIDIHDIITISLGFCQNDLAAKDQTLTLELDADDSLIDGDAGRLQQVFWNLIKNAVKFTPEGGEITIRTSNPSVGSVCIEVRDNGIGIEAEQLARIFRPFEQGEQTITRRYGGLGLGLAISSAIVRMHNGTIRAFSDGVNQGATFTIELPVHTAHGGEPANGVSVDELSYSRLRILVVESPNRRKAISSLLENHGYLLHISHGAESALEIAQSELLDIVVIDIDGGVEAGIDLYTTLARINAVRGIIVDAGDRLRLLERVRAAGADEFLARPVTFAKLQGAIRNVVG